MKKSVDDFTNGHQPDLSQTMEAIAENAFFAKAHKAMHCHIGTQLGSQENHLDDARP